MNISVRSIALGVAEMNNTFPLDTTRNTQQGKGSNIKIMKKLNLGPIFKFSEV